MIRHGYLELFAGEPTWLDKAKALAERTYEFSEFLVDVLEIQDIQARFDGKLT
jgi:L-lactate dehydrogenase complex protein LldE